MKEEDIKWAEKKLSMDTPLDKMFEKINKLFLKIIDNEEYKKILKEHSNSDLKNGFYVAGRFDEDVYYLKLAHKKYSEIK
jgi:hypothetical protein